VPSETSHAAYLLREIASHDDLTILRTIDALQKIALPDTTEDFFSLSLSLSLCDFRLQTLLKSPLFN